LQSAKIGRWDACIPTEIIRSVISHTFTDSSTSKSAVKFPQVRETSSTHHEIHNVDVRACLESWTTIVGAYVHGSVSAEDNPGSLGAIDASQIALDPVRGNNIKSVKHSIQHYLLVMSGIRAIDNASLTNCTGHFQHDSHVQYSCPSCGLFRHRMTTMACRQWRDMAEASGHRR
jgi:hypothetical protein